MDKVLLLFCYLVGGLAAMYLEKPPTLYRASNRNMHTPLHVVCVSSDYPLELPGLLF